MKEIGSMWFLNPLKPQNKSKMAKNCQSAATVIDSFWQFLTHFWALKDLKTTSNLFSSFEGLPKQISAQNSNF